MLHYSGSLLEKIGARAILRDKTITKCLTPNSSSNTATRANTQTQCRMFCGEQKGTRHT